MPTHPDTATTAAENIREGRELIRRIQEAGGPSAEDRVARLRANLLTHATLLIHHGEGDDLELGLDELRASKARAALRVVARVGEALAFVGAGDRITTGEWAAAADHLAAAAYEDNLARWLAQDDDLRERLDALLPGDAGADPLAGMRGPDGELGTDIEPETYLAQRDADAELGEEV